MVLLHMVGLRGVVVGGGSISPLWVNVSGERGVGSKAQISLYKRAGLYFPWDCGGLAAATSIREGVCEKAAAVAKWLITWRLKGGGGFSKAICPHLLRVSTVHGARYFL